MKAAELEEIRSLIGDSAVLIPIKAGRKSPAFKGWQKLTASSRHDEELQKMLRSHGNVEMLLGDASDGLCTIDIDHDAEVERFLQCNPRLKETLQTRGGRGGNLWVRIIRGAPRLTALQRNGEPWVEWRGNGAQTVIQGIHPSKKRYSSFSSALRDIEAHKDRVLVEIDLGPVETIVIRRPLDFCFLRPSSMKFARHLYPLGCPTTFFTVTSEPSAISTYANRHEN